eukprot:9198457-Pyramimonas_sp.AAC.1
MGPYGRDPLAPTSKGGLHTMVTLCTVTSGARLQGAVKEAESKRAGCYHRIGISDKGTPVGPHQRSLRRK